MFRACLCVLFATSAFAAEPTRHEWTVGGVKREGLIALPEKATKAAPVVFAFHGHGGSMKNAAAQFPIHKLWPEAVCVGLHPGTVDTGLSRPFQANVPTGQ